MFAERERWDIIEMCEIISGELTKEWGIGCDKTVDCNDISPNQSNLCNEFISSEKVKSLHEKINTMSHRGMLSIDSQLLG